MQYSSVPFLICDFTFSAFIFILFYATNICIAYVLCNTCYYELLLFNRILAQKEQLCVKKGLMSCLLEEKSVLSRYQFKIRNYDLLSFRRVNTPSGREIWEPYSVET